MGHRSSRVLVLSILSYSIFQSLPGVFVGGTNLLYFGQDSHYPTVQQFAEWFTVAEVVTLFLFSLLSERMSPAMQKTVSFFSIVLMLAGLFLLTIYSLSATNDLSLFMGAALLLGASYSGAFFAWMRVLLSMPLKQSVTVVIGGTFGSGVLNAIMHFTTSITLCFLMLTVAGVVHSAALLWFNHKEEAAPNLQPVSATGFPRSTFRPLGLIVMWGLRAGSFYRTWWRSVVSVAVIGFAGGVARAMLIAEDFGAFSLVSSMFFVGSILSSVFLFPFIHKITSAESFDALFTSLFFVSATAFLFVPLFPIAYLSVLIGVENMLFAIASMCMIFLCLKLLVSNEGSLLFTVGLFVGTAYLGVGLGQKFGSFIGQEFSYVVTSVLSVYIVLLLGILTGYRKRLSNTASEPPAQAPAVFIQEITEESIRSNPLFTDAYGLSKREMDVLVLALNGRNAASIAEKLFISENTVRTHLKRMYKKLGVHNRQELLELIEKLCSSSVPLK